MKLSLDVLVVAPEWMKERGIDSASYATLKSLLESNTIYWHKFMWSDLAKHDIGTPETVRRIVFAALVPQDLIRIAPPGARGYWGSCYDRQSVISGLTGLNEFGLEEFCDLTTAGYLLGTDFSHPESNPAAFVPELACTKTFPDNDGKNQLEGELRRYWAQKNSIQSPRDVSVDAAIVQDYCNTHGLPRFEGAFAATLAWQQFLK